MDITCSVHPKISWAYQKKIFHITQKAGVSLVQVPFSYFKIGLHVHLHEYNFVRNMFSFCRTWDFKLQSTPLETIEHHTEFVYGLDWNIHIPGQVSIYKIIFKHELTSSLSQNMI